MHKCVILFRGRSYNDASEPMPLLIPLSLISLASPLRSVGFTVKIIDACVDDYTNLPEDTWKDVILVGISALTGNEIADGISFAHIVREKTLAPIVWGGWHVSMLPEESIANEYVDIVAVGAGQNTIVELARCITCSGNLQDVPGIYYKDNGKVVKTIDRCGGSLRSTSLPAFDMLPLDHYRKESMSIRHGTNIDGLDITGHLYYISSFGCPNKCSYCCNSNMFKNKMLFYDILPVVEQIKWLVGAKRFNSIGFMDANFFANMPRVKLFCNEIVRQNIKFAWDAQMYVRDILRYEKNNILELLRKAGCFRVNVGVESGSQEILDYIKKGITADEIIASAKILKKYGFCAAYNLLFGLPMIEEQKHIYETFDLAKELKKVNPDFSLPFSFYVPFPGTSMYADAVEKGMVAPKKLEDWGQLSIEYALANTMCGQNAKKIEKLIHDVITFYAPLGFPGSMKRGTIVNLEHKIKNSKLRFVIKLFSWIARKRLDQKFYRFRIEPIVFNWYNKNKYRPGSKVELTKQL